MLESICWHINIAEYIVINHVLIEIVKYILIVVITYLKIILTNLKINYKV